jgi:indolepyruvate ferredoxin oxidoreductase
MTAGATDSAFSCTVARQLFHLMAYKDEYEVARLHRDPRFRAAVAAEFGEGADVTFLLQPPSATHLGLRRKIHVKPAAATAMFGSLARMKGLRGRRLDPFGRSRDRRTERALIDEYVALADALTRHLGTDAHDDAVRAVGLVDMVRGYAEVKDRNLERYRGELAAALADLQNGSQP